MRGPAMSERAWTRVFVLVGLAAAGLCAIFVLDYTRYPYPPHRLFIFDYLLRTRDLPGAAVVAAIALAAALPGIARPALRLVEAVGEHPWYTASLAFVVLCAAQVVVAKNFALAGDEYLVLMQARAFAAGHLTAKFPPELITWVVPWPYVDKWLFASRQTGVVVSVYWPGFALLLSPFVLLGVPWACNALLASGSLVLAGKLARRLTGTAAAGGWAMLFALASPGFTSMALSYYSMAAHLLFNLLFAWLLLEPTPRRLAAAGVVGSFALILNNPLPHFLFALPWIVWLGWRDGRYALLRLGAGYAPLTLVGGLGWWLLMRHVQGEAQFAPYASDGQLGNWLGNFIFHWQLQFDRVFAAPDASTVGKRAAELVKLWLWTVPGLPALALAGWWLGRRDVRIRLLGVSFACTLAGYLWVWFDQGFGWGVRYLHPALGALPVLAAAAITRLSDETAGRALRRYAAAAIALSLAIATPFRWGQIQSFVADHLSHRPPFQKGVPQAVFVTLNWEYYTQDFIQNDPFLRDSVIFLLSRGRTRDEALLRRFFPPATLEYAGRYGNVWRLEAPFSDRTSAQRPAK